MVWDGVQPPRYDKPHLTFDQQLDLLTSRGLTVNDRNAALAALRAVGYYRLSAYLYHVFDTLHVSAQH